LLDLVARPHKLDPWSSTNIAHRNAMNNSKLERLLNVTHSARDARESLKQVVPAIRSGININTHLGNLTLNGEDAEAIFGLVTEIALRRSGQGGIEGVKKAAASIVLAPNESALIAALHQHGCQVLTYGTRIPLEDGDLRTAKSLQRKGLALVMPAVLPAGSMLFSLTPLGAAVYERESAPLRASAEEHA